MEKYDGKFETVGKNMRAVRLSRNMTLEELSKLIGITPGYLGLMERGKRGISVRFVQKLANIFQVPVDSFFEKEEERKALEPIDSLKAKLICEIECLSEKELNFLDHMVTELKKINRK